MKIGGKLITESTNLIPKCIGLDQTRMVDAGVVDGVG